METNETEFKRDLNTIAKIITADESFTVTVYLSPNDGAPVVEIDTTGELRVYINDGAVFDGHTEVRYILKPDAGPMRYYGVWDNVENTWYAEGSYDDAYYFAGVPMWRKEKDARNVIDQLNGKALQ